MKKISYEPLTSARHAHEKSIDIWTVISNMPDGTDKYQVLEYTFYPGRERANHSYVNSYHFDCPLCDYAKGEDLFEYKDSCFSAKCPLITDNKWCCNSYEEPYQKWTDNSTAANAQAVLNQLHDTYKQRYGEEYVTDIMEQLKGEEE